MILVLALGLRLFALGWGLPNFEHDSFHPDETAGYLSVHNLWQDPRHLATTYFASTRGIGFFYVGMAAMMVESRLGIIESPEAMLQDAPTIHRAYLTLRALAVGFSTGTVFLVFLIGRRLFQPRVGELAALIEAVSPISVINAHFIKIDSALSFLVMLGLYLAARSSGRRAWLAAAVLVSGVAAAFKYPGGSAIIFPVAAAILLNREERARRLKLVAFSAPLFAVGFFACYPSAMLYGRAILAGMSWARDNAFAGSILKPFQFMASYPFRLMPAEGVPLVAWSLAAVGWALKHRRPETLLILAWLLPYYAIMSSSAVVLTRYAVPMMPALALLMSSLVFDLAARKPAGLKSGALAGMASVAILLILSVTLIHLRTMKRPDPRDQAGQWIQQNVPAHEIIAVTASHRDDESFTVSVNPAEYEVIRLDFRPRTDVSSYLRHPFHYLAANEKAWVHSTRHPSQINFWREVNDPRSWELMVSFTNRPAWPGVLLRGTLPEDLYYLYQETRVYRRRQD